MGLLCCSPVKKGGALWLFIDYRNLNNSTITDFYAIRSIDDLLDIWEVVVCSQKLDL